MKNGIIAVNKPEGISSARLVSRIKKALDVEKAGHTGTLDPFATGLMLCPINKATRISQFFLGGHKKYLARIYLGRKTDTCDLTGKTIYTAPDGFIDTLRKSDIEMTVKSFTGIQDQIPPIFSALKHKGQPLYKLARQGKQIKKPSRQIEIFSLEIQQIKRPFLDMEVFCSSGTYIRSLADDIGKKLGCGAHLSKLCRTRSSIFKLEDAIELAALETLDKKEALKRVVPMSACLNFMPEIAVKSSIVKKVRFGQKLLAGEGGDVFTQPGEPVRITGDNSELIAIVKLNENRQEYDYSCVFIS